jgi:hypothetical protein
MFLQLTKRFYFGYTPSIKFPNRHASTLHTNNFSFSGRKIKLTNRDALNQAMS